MRQLTAYASYLDNLGAPLVGRARFYNFDDSPAVVYGLDNAHQHYVQLGHIVYTNSSGQLVPQVFLADHDYLVAFDKYIGGGTMAEDDDPESWQEMGSAVDKYNTVGIELDGNAVRSFGTVDALRAAIPVESADGDNEIVELLGYYEPGDKPSIQYQWDPDSSEPDNGGSVLGAGAVGRWKLVECPEFLDVRHFGAFPDQTSGGNADQRNRVQLAGAYAHFNSCGIHFYGDALAVYYDISGLELFKTTSDDFAKAYAVAGTESTIREVVSINCGADQFTPLSSQGKITLYGDLLRASFAPSYNVQFEPTRKIVIDANVDTQNLEVWNSLVEVVVDTTSHWKFYNCQVESDRHVGENVSFLGPTNLEESMFMQSIDLSTITVDDGVICDIDDFYTMSEWCKLVIQQSAREFDIDGHTLDSQCNLNFPDGTLTLHNAKLSGFSCSLDLELKDCRGTINYYNMLPKTLRLDGCSEGIVLGSINSSATIVSRNSLIQVNSDVTVLDVNMFGSTISSSSRTITVRGKFEAIDSKVQCKVDARLMHGTLSLTDCVVTSDVAGKTVTARGCIFSDANVDAYSPYNGSDRNVISVDAVGNKFLGSSKLRLVTGESSTESTLFDISFNVCGNFSDHDFVDDSAFNGVTHTVNVLKCVYKGNYGGCPSDSSSHVQSILYSPATLTSGDSGYVGTIPSNMPDNVCMFFSDSRPATIIGPTSPCLWTCLKVNRTVQLSSVGIFHFEHLDVKTNVLVSPDCKCIFMGSNAAGPFDEYGYISMCVAMTSYTYAVKDSLLYNDTFSVDAGGNKTASLRGYLDIALSTAQIHWEFKILNFQ